MAANHASFRHRIVANPEVLAGKPTIKGTRIPVDLVLEYLANNPNFDELFVDYPELTLADVQAALAYARAAVDSEDGAPLLRRGERGRIARPAV